MSSGDLYYLSPPEQEEPFYWEVSTELSSDIGLKQVPNHKFALIPIIQLELSLCFHL